MENHKISFSTFLKTAFDQGKYATDDVIAFVLPMFKKVLNIHEKGLVCPFEHEDCLFVTGLKLDIDETFCVEEKQAVNSIQELFAEERSHHFEIVGKEKWETDINGNQVGNGDLLLHLHVHEPLLHTAYIKGYNCFETLIGHHDIQTDIFCLGLILGSMALGLNLHDENDLRTFVQHRRNPIQFNDRVHPTIGALITAMTSLDAQKRTQDLHEVIQQLQHYRDFDPEKHTDLSQVAGWINKDLSERNQLILNKLRNRLFDISRRNRLLYYKPNARFVNLTVSSVPLVLHHENIQPEHLFTWNNDIESKVTDMKELILNKYLRFEDHSYLTATLDKIRVESQRDIQEFGFSQMKMVIAFLNWHNLNEDIEERIQSPLLLIPTALKKTKRLKEDHYTLHLLDNVAEVNPVLANLLNDLYGIKLPDFVDLDEMSLTQFYTLLKEQIDESHQGIQLRYTDKPKIKLIYNIAAQTVNNHNRRQRKNAYKFGSNNNDSSHANDISTEHPIADQTKEIKLYQLEENDESPYSWDFDVCNIVLGNFNYKKMSLVRDYNHVIDNKVKNKVFENLFGNLPKQLKEQVYNLNKPEEWNHVITADPTQTQAILKSRSGESYIIQGPPGTGKSQTITNLIADFVAHGKRILFVCEKRAALDVVYYRLKQNNLDELCCYIHDSQGDKKTFIKNLQATYDEFTQKPMNLRAIEQERKYVVVKLNVQIEILHQFHSLNLMKTAAANIPVRTLIDRVIALKGSIVQLSSTEIEQLPTYNDWIQFGDTIQQLEDALEDSGAEASFASHPISKLNDTIFLSNQPHGLLDNLLSRIQNLLNELNNALVENNIAPSHSTYLHQIKNLLEDANMLQPLAEQNNLDLVNPNSPAAKAFDKQIKSYKKTEEDYKKKQKSNSNWNRKLSEFDTTYALSIATKQEDSFFSFLNGSWRRLKRQLEESYDFSKHQVKPSYSSILQQLEHEYAVENQLKKQQEELQYQYKLDDINAAGLNIEAIRNKKGDKEIDYLLAHKDSNELVRRLSKLNNVLHQLELQLNQCLYEYEDKSMNEINDELHSISMNANSLQDLLPALRQFALLPENIKNIVRKIQLTPIQTEATIAHKTLDYIFQQHKRFAETDVTVIETAVRQIKHCYKQLLKLNADRIKASISERFAEHVAISNTATSQLNADQKQFKKAYNEGRKILENEFGKSMRYKSIRELSAKESGLVLKDIKPIWLMSPLSVSDSLPLDTAYFDVVIFDEASQITLEEGIPALYRAPQTIIVGDDKQMPPSNFFSASAEDPDDLEQHDDENEDETLSIDADSLLVQGARKLSSTMLSWHYRSHYETLISFSNHAFYDGALLTIPDQTIHHKEKQNIEVTEPRDATKFADCLYDRSISFHFQLNGVYEKRSNQAEAQYIAQLVCTLLKTKVKETIGIVAFSQEQQHIIEDALTALASKDKTFEDLLEAAYNRTEDDQFVGLIIKNLENIQGDERDIIIMSVCYGFDTHKKMLMNFGPINKKGGEKRLNVIFSRAKKHMAIISSIKYHNITNEYNEGANYFRRFLQYAENVSIGNMQLARTILDSLILNKHRQIQKKPVGIVSKELMQALLDKGFEVVEQVGQSDFKCSLAVSLHKDDEKYTLCILIDDEKHYQNMNLMEQYYQRPDILQSFGWRYIHVFAKDWLLQPQKVLEQILKRIKEEPKSYIEEDASASTDISKEAINLKAFPTADLAGFENMQFERLSYKDDTTNKFWEVGMQENKLVIHYGKTGNKGTMQVKTFEEITEALMEKEKMIAEKLGKGYLMDEG
jgi:predicted DNA-binding WGR domain protein/DNA polymerase III delta prime subunit